MFNLISSRYRESAALATLRQEFERSGYVRFPGFLEEQALAAIVQAISHVRSKARRRSFMMPGLNTPRQLNTLGGQQIALECPFLAALYFHHELVGIARAISGDEVYRCQHRQEFMVANFLTRAGDCHGWHTDDPALALVLIIEAPPPGNGGDLEFITDWPSVCAGWDVSPVENLEPHVERARAEGRVCVTQHAPGDAYLLKASTTLHRVTALTGEQQRAVLNMAYQEVPQQAYGTTATALYGSDDSAEDGVGARKEMTGADWVWRPVALEEEAR
jgi:hypothetical protein